MAIKPFVALSLVLTISACATGVSSLPEPPTYPSDAWLEANLPTYVEGANADPTAANRALVADLQALASRRQREGAKMRQVDRDLTLSWGNRGRGGAAMREPAYIHVLGDPLNDRYDMDEQRFTTSNGLLPSSVPDKEDGDHNWITVGASMYELQRWERYCDQGRGMDEPDWRFVTDAGAPKSIPDILVMGCHPPEHNLTDYLQAWTSFCESDSPSVEQRQIVRNSSRPKTVVNPCKALN